MRGVVCRWRCTVSLLVVGTLIAILAKGQALRDPQAKGRFLSARYSTAESTPRLTAGGTITLSRSAAPSHPPRQTQGGSESLFRGIVRAEALERPLSGKPDVEGAVIPDGRGAMHGDPGYRIPEALRRVLLQGLGEPAGLETMDPGKHARDRAFVNLATYGVPLETPEEPEPWDRTQHGRDNGTQSVQEPVHGGGRRAGARSPARRETRELVEGVHSGMRGPAARRGPQYPEVPLSKFWQRKPSAGSTWPRIYFYDLPILYKNATRWGLIDNYGTEIVANDWLKRHGYVTTNASEADLFYVDAWFYEAMYDILFVLGAECGYPGRMPFSCITLHALNHIRKEFPYFDRSKGVDHIWMLTQDHGFCGFQGGGDFEHQEIASGIIAEHWGLTKPEHWCTVPDRLNYGWCKDLHRMEGHKEERLACYVPGKDVLLSSTYRDKVMDGDPNKFKDVPDPILPPGVNSTWPAYDNQTLKCALWDEVMAGELTVHMYPTRPRPLKLYMAGTVGQWDPRYSHSVRQHIHIFEQNRTGILLVEGDDLQYFSHLAGSRFCLAPTGGGWGVRFKLALMCGCIPVVIADYVAVENNDVFNLTDFSIRLPEAYVFSLVDALDYIEHHHAAQVETMQRRIACAWRYWVWNEPYGRAGEAYICALRRKLMGHERLVPRMDWDTCTLHCDVPDGSEGKGKEPKAVEKAGRGVSISNATLPESDGVERKRQFAFLLRWIVSFFLETVVGQSESGV